MKSSSLVLTRTRFPGPKISRTLRRKTPIFPIVEFEDTSAYRYESKSNDLDCFNGTIESATVQHFDIMGFSERTFHVNFDDGSTGKFKAFSRTGGLFRGRIIRNGFDPMVEYRQGLIDSLASRRVNVSNCLPVGTIVSERADHHTSMRETIALLPLGVIVDWVEIEQPDRTLEWCPMVYWVDRRVYGIQNPMHLANELEIIKYQTQVLSEIQKKVAGAERKRESLAVPVPGRRRPNRIIRSTRLSAEEVTKQKRLRKKLQKEFPPAKKPVKSKMEL